MGNKVSFVINGIPIETTISGIFENDLDNHCAVIKIDEGIEIALNTIDFFTLFRSLY